VVFENYSASLYVTFWTTCVAGRRILITSDNLQKRFSNNNDDLDYNCLFSSIILVFFALNGATKYQRGHSQRGVTHSWDI